MKPKYIVLAGLAMLGVAIGAGFRWEAGLGSFAIGLLITAPIFIDD